MADLWSYQEIECYLCKRSKGCKSCSIRKTYKITNCNMFDVVLSKFRLYGPPKITKE